MSCDCEVTDLVEYILGDTVPLEVALRSQKTGLAFDLTGLLAAACYVKTAAADADAAALVTWLLGTGISVIDATGTTTAGQTSLLHLFPTVENSAALAAAVTYACQLRLTLATGVSLTVPFFLRTSA